MNSVEFISESEFHTDVFAGVLAELLPPNVTVALVGTLGAGKTRLVQAVAAAIGISRDDVTSPTFVICQHYSGRGHTIHHLDAYRVSDVDEWFDLGVDELFEESGWILVEWADRFEDYLPEDYLRIDIEVVSDRARRFRVTAVGPTLSIVIEKLKTWMKAAG